MLRRRQRPPRPRPYRRYPPVRRRYLQLLRNTWGLPHRHNRFRALLNLLHVFLLIRTPLALLLAVVLLNLVQ